MSHYSGSVPDTEPGREWLPNAACASLGDLMFPDTNERGITAAKHVCARCPVWEACLTNALDTGDNQWGIRGGLTDRERRALAKERAANPATPLPDPRQPQQHRPTTLTEAVQRRTVRTPDGHLTWTGAPNLRFANQRYTALQAAFTVGYGRDPVGTVRRTCGEDCYRAAHLTDTVMREAAAVCGTPEGYRKHKKYGETACRPCLVAHGADARPKAATA